MAHDDEINEIKRAEAMRRIAQLKFKQALKKDIVPDASAHFCDALDAVLQQNTPANIQVST